MTANTANPLMSTYNRQQVTFERGSGVWLWDADGNRYFDALSGIAVVGLGHAHPNVTEAICLQAGELLHTSNLYCIAHQEALAQRLTRLSGMDNAFFCNSGAEANEVALKMARRYGNDRGIKCPTVVTMSGSFHGRTMATLSATGNPKVHAGFEPLVPGFVYADYGDVAAVEALFATRDDIVAVFVEPIQGEGGINVPPRGYLEGLRALCDKHDALLMLDEIQSGMGRTGKWFAFQHEDLQPDVMTLAKALGNGVPIGACLAGPKAANLLQPGSHGSTFGGNPLACRAALAVVDTMENEAIIDRCQALSRVALEGFTNRLGGHAAVKEIRIRGLMIGIELDRPCGELVGRALASGILLNVTADSVVRLLPPLVMSDDEAGQLVGDVSNLIEAFCGEQ